MHYGVHRLLRSPIVLLLLLRPPSLLRVIILMEAALVEKHACPATSEEHLEYVVWINVLLSVLLMISHSVVLRAMLIIYPSLGLITQTGEGS